MLLLAVSFAFADAAPVDTGCSTDGASCTTASGDAGTCVTKDGVLTCEADTKTSDDTICGLVGVASAPLLLAGLLPALVRRRPA